MKEIFVNLDRCLGCRSCQIACAVEHSTGKSLFAAVAETPGPRYRLFVERSESLNIPLTCRHCDPAPCLDACISGAIKRDSRGVVVQQEDRCVGCWTCLMMCPYGVVTQKPEQKVALKCDRCPDREAPACVSACPTRALVYTEPDNFAAGVRKIEAGVVAGAVKG